MHLLHIHTCYLKPIPSMWELYFIFITRNVPIAQKWRQFFTSISRIPLFESSYINFQSYAINKILGQMDKGKSKYFPMSKCYKILYKNFFNYSKVPIIRTPMVLVESGLNTEQVCIYTDKCISVLKQVVLIVRMVLILSGLYWGTLL